VTHSETFKKAYKDLVGRWFFSTWRWAERRFSPQAFYSLLKPFSLARATANCAFRKRAYATPRPDFLRVPEPARAERQQRMNDYLNHILELFPDRLSEEKWIQNCRVEGLEHLQSACRNKCPTVLAFSHFGPFFLLRFLLRAKGIPTATLLGGESEKRGPLMRLKDGFSPFNQVPISFYGDQLRAASEFIATGNPLLVAIDVPVNKQIDVPFCDGWAFQMAAGAVRLAMRCNAELIPCSIVDEGCWHFSIKFGKPVPKELLLSENDWLPAGKHLMDEMIPIFRTWPEQCRPDLIRRLKPAHGH
jgi:lauroyl/myristoyl acyltransferase